MNRSFIYIILFLSNTIIYGQVRQSSNVLKFQNSSDGLAVSGYSNSLSYGINNNSAISACSNKLLFGLSKEKSIEDVQKNHIVENTVVKSQIINNQESQAVSVQLLNPIVEKEVQQIRVPIVTTQVDEKKEIPKQEVASRDVSSQMSTVITDQALIISKNLGEEYATKLPKYHALIMGVSDYKYNGSGIASLENPANDAQKLYDILTKNYVFDTAFVTLLKNPNRQQIIDALELLSSEITPKDNLLVFYAGHGFYDKQKEFGYWLPSDSKITSRSDWIANSTIKDYLSSIRSKHTLLISDACFGGSIFKSRAIDANMFMKVHDLYKDPSRKAITSGNLSEVPDKSLFLEQLLKKLVENTDDFLPAQKLFSRIYEPITNNSEATPQFGVIQGAGDEGGDFIFIRKQK